MPIFAGEVEWYESEIAKEVPLGKIPHFLVREFERALFIRDGKIYQEFGPGRHVTSGLPGLSMSYLFYISYKPLKLKWGLPETLSQDNVTLGCFGTVELQVDNAKMFWAQVVGNKKVYTEQDLREHILSNLQGVIRSELANLTIHQIYLERDVLIAAVRARLKEMFGSMGIDYKRIEVVGINIPEDIKKALGSSKIFEIEFQQKKSMVELEVNKAKGLAEAGVDATKIKELEIAEKNPEILAKKYETQAYKDAMQASRTQTVNVGMVTTPTVSMTQPQAKTKGSCPSCKKLVSSDFNLCPYCGHTLKSNTCPSCGREIQAGFKKCPYCGSEI